MKRIVLFFVMFLLLMGCQNNEPVAIDNEVEEPDVVENEIEVPDETEEAVPEFQVELLNGIWLNNDDKVLLLSLYGDGTFITNDSTIIGSSIKETEYILGTWSIENDQLIMIGESNLMDENDQSSFDIQAFKVAVEDGLLKLNDHTYDFETENHIAQHESIFGVYNRTNIYPEQWGEIELSSQSPYYLKVWGLYGGETSTNAISGLVFYTKDDFGVYYHHQRDDEGIIPKMYFDISGSHLVISTNKLGEAFGLEKEVFVDGTFTTGDVVFLDEPIRSISNRDNLIKGKMLEFFGYSEKEWIETLLASQEIAVDEIIEYTLPNNHQLVMLYDEFNFLHALVTNGFGEQVYMTNNSEYPQIYLDAFIPYIKDKEALLIEQISESSRNRFSDYVWIAGHYVEPKSWSDPDSIKWGEASNYNEFLEIHVNGRVKSVKLVSLEWEDFGLIEGEEVASELDVQDQTIVVKTIQTEGIPALRIVIEDLMGNIYKYNITDRSLSGMPGHDNTTLVQINRTSMTNEIIVPLITETFVIPALKQTVKEPQEIVPESWSIKDRVSLDYNEDGLMDYMMILETQNYQGPRLLISLRNTGSHYDLDLLDYKIIEPRSVSGLDGDSYLPLEVDDNDIIITQLFGSNGYEKIRYTLTYDFAWRLKYDEKIILSLGHIDDYEFNDYDNNKSIRGYNHTTEENQFKDTAIDGPYDVSIAFEQTNEKYLFQLNKESYIDNNRDITSEYISILINKNVDARLIDLEMLKEHLKSNYVIFDGELYVIHHNGYALLARIIYDPIYEHHDALEIIDLVKIEEHFGYYDLIEHDRHIFMIVPVEDTERLQLVSLNTFSGEKTYYFEFEMTDDDPLNFLHASVEYLNEQLLVKATELKKETFYVYDLKTNMVKMIGERLLRSE